MPMLDNRLSPPTNKSVPLQIDRQLKQRRNLDFGTDKVLIPSGDTVTPTFHINPPFNGEWDLTEGLSPQQKQYVVYFKDGKRLPCGNVGLLSVFQRLRATKRDRDVKVISLELLSLAATKKNKPVQLDKQENFMSTASDVLSGCFKIESESYSSQTKEVGSAFYIRGDTLVTCAHVISRQRDQDFSNIAIFVIDADRRFVAKVLDIDYDLDIALLYCDAVQHTTLPVKSIKKVGVGHDVLCVGSPYGYDNNVSQGIISSKDRIVGNRPAKYFFVDLSVYPGSSGGPVIDKKDGHVIGVASIIVESVGNYGLNAAIPIDACLERFGEVIDREGGE